MLCLLVLFHAHASLLGDQSLDLKERPVTKVIRLLQDMQSQLEKEKAADEELYEKLSCWCSTSEEDKTAAVAKANKMIDDYVATISSTAARSATLKATIAQLEKETAKNTKTLNEATTMRETENNEFLQTEKDLLASIESLRTAILVLGKHHESFLQVDRAAMVAQVHSSLQAVLSRAKLLPTAQKKLIQSYLSQMPVKGQSYAPQSGIIFGTLKTMKETFETNLADAKSEEANAAKEFSELKAAKTNEINAATAQVEADKTELAETEELNANSKENLENTREALDADRKFLLELKQKCTKQEDDWAERSKTRADEIAAVSETIGILSEDDAHDLFAKSVSFVQVRRETSARAKAFTLLNTQARKTQSSALLKLATSVKLDSFTKVKAAIDDMVAALKKTKQDDVEQRDFCIEEFNTNEKNTQKKQREIDLLQRDIKVMTSTIETLTKDIADLTADVKEMNKQMTIASEDREQENKEFQEVVADQRATQAVLKKAIARMEVFYKSFIQQEPGAAVPPPPGAFKEYKKNAGSGGVLVMMNNLVEESHGLEMTAIKDEGDSQAAYEEFILNTNDSVDVASRTIMSKSNQKSDTDSAKIAAEGDLSAALEDAENLGKEAGDLHKSCDFLIKNFDVRQAALGQEIEALGQAKGILSGA